MGFRSLLLTEDTYLEVPAWFVEKYPSLVAQRETDGKLSLPIASKFETKFYGTFGEDERFLDLQKILIADEDPERTIDVILFHECGGITKVVISPTAIVGLEPYEWRTVDHVEHHYCYGCSDPDKVAVTNENN
jgi:hypothetical protein